MKYFTIDNENNITLHASAQEADAVPDTERFSTSAGLAKLADKWPAARLVEIWNSVPGVSQVKKFTDRKKAATRVWNAIQSLGEPATAKSEAIVPATEPTPEVEAAISASFRPEPQVAVEPASQPEAVIATTEAPATEQPVSPEPADEPVASVAAQAPDVAPAMPPMTKKASRAKKTPAGETGAPREGSKTSRVIAMLKRDGGTTLEEIMSEMGWLKHTTRAMLSAGGALAKKHGLVVTSEKIDDRRMYSIKG